MEDLFLSHNDRLINVVETSFIKESRMTYDELFEGYDKLYAITYSSDVSLMNKLFSKFSYSEVIFGWDKVLGKEHRSLFDVPVHIIRYFGKNNNVRTIASYMDEGKVKLLTLHDFKSHIKQYVLVSSDGRHRVITGSANMSTAAMYGIQAENFIVDDTDAAFSYYMNRHEILRKYSGEINKEIFINIKTKKVENVEKAIETSSVKDIIGTDTAVIIEGVDIEDIQDSCPVAILDPALKGRARKEISDIMGQPEQTPNGLKICIPREKLIYQKRLIFERTSQKKEIELPSLHIDYSTNSIVLNGESLTHAPERADICQDIQCIIDYFDGLRMLKGDIERTLRDYWKFVCWYLSSPFIARLRLVALSTGYDTYNRLSNIGVLYGNSNAGKTLLCKFLTKLMDGNIRTGIPINYFTPAKIDNYRSRNNGFPIFFEDVDQAKWSQIENNIVKNDNFGKEERRDLYSCIAVCMNRTKAFHSEAKKRCLAIRVEASFDEEETYLNSADFKEKIFKVSNNFYKIYLLRMLKEVSQIESDMINNKKDIEYNISVVSSNVIISIVNDYLGYVPNFMRQLHAIEDLVGNKIKFSSGIEMLGQLIELDPSAFILKEKKNQLIYKQSDFQTSHINFLRQELPSGWLTMDKSQIKGVMIINLDEVKKAGISLSPVKGKEKWYDSLLSWLNTK